MKSPSAAKKRITERGTTDKRRPKTRRPGRPLASASPDSRQALIDAARELFAAHSFGDVSTKRIATAAGVNPAMIHYHFAGKDDLLETAFREAVEPLLEQLGALSKHSAAAPPRVAQAIEIYMRTLANNPWLAPMIVRHVLPPGGRLQAIAVNAISTRVAPLIRQGIERGQEANHLRGDLDPVRTTLSLVSLALFPFISLPLTRQVFGFELTPAFVNGLIEHTVALFQRGTATGAQS
jgi:AcrR family transcriptional regulator